MTTGFYVGTYILNYLHYFLVLNQPQGRGIIEARMFIMELKGALKGETEAGAPVMLWSAAGHCCR